MKTQTIDRPQLSRFNNKVVVVSGTTTNEVIVTPEGYTQLFKEVKVNRTTFRDQLDLHIYNHFEKVDHMFLPVERRLPANRRDFSLAGVTQIYTRDGGSKSYGVRQPKTKIEELESRVRAAMYLILGLHSNWDKLTPKKRSDGLEQIDDIALDVFGTSDRSSWEKLAYQALNPELLLCFSRFMARLWSPSETRKKRKKRKKKTKNKGFGN